MQASQTTLETAQFPIWPNIETLRRVRVAKSNLRSFFTFSFNSAHFYPMKQQFFCLMKMIARLLQTRIEKSVFGCN